MNAQKLVEALETLSKLRMHEYVDDIRYERAVRSLASKALEAAKNGDAHYVVGPALLSWQGLVKNGKVQTLRTRLANLHDRWARLRHYVANGTYVDRSELLRIFNEEFDKTEALLKDCPLPDTEEWRAKYGPKDPPESCMREARNMLDPKLFENSDDYHTAVMSVARGLDKALEDATGQKEG